MAQSRGDNPNVHRKGVTDGGPARPGVEWFSMKRLFIAACLFALSGLTIVGLPTQAAAQSTSTYAAGMQWGATPGGVAVNGAYESALGHAVDGQIAGQVNAARIGGLIGLQGSSLSITSIGSQTNVTNSVSGQNITSSINATQSSSNSGSVSNTGTITPTQ
jgi:hypothetical protein